MFKSNYGAIILHISLLTSGAHAIAHNLDTPKLKCGTRLEAPIQSLIANTDTAVELFDSQGKPALNYRNQIKFLMKAPAGTRIHFGPGGDLYFRRFLGSGATTFVIETMDGRVARLPLGIDSQSFLARYLDVHQELESAGIPVVKLHRQLSRPPYFLIVDKVNIQFTLEDLVNGTIDLNSTLGKMAEQKLIELAARTWKYTFISDLKRDSVVFADGQWILIDFGNDSPNQYMRSRYEVRNVFSPQSDDYGWYKMVPDSTAAKIEPVIARIRKSQSLNDADAPNDEVWFHRSSIIANADDYTINSEGPTTKPLSNSIGINLDSMKKNGKKRFKKASDYDISGVAMIFTDIAEVGRDSVLYNVKFKFRGSNEIKAIKGLYEINLNEGDDKVGRLLKKHGYDKSDVVYTNRDGALILK